MTIAIGIGSLTFMIVAADSQESWDVVKRPSRKVWISTLSERTKTGAVRGRVAITGAGGSDYLAYLKRQIGDRIQRTATQATFADDVRDAIESELVEFYDKHFAPLAHLETHKYNEPSLIIGGVFGAARGLWRTHGTTVISHGMGYEAVGTGAVWAREVLDSNITFLGSQHAATLTACYAIYSAKERDGYCGKDTHVASLRPDAPLLEWADRNAIRAAEDVFREYDELRALMLSAIVTPPKYNVDIAADRQLDEIRARLSAIEFYPTTQQAETGSAIKIMSRTVSG